MKRNYFLFQSYFTILLNCGIIILTVGNLKAGSLLTVIEPCNEISGIPQQESFASDVSVVQNNVNGNKLFNHFNINFEKINVFIIDREKNKLLSNFFGKIFTPYHCKGTNKELLKISYSDFDHKDVSEYIFSSQNQLKERINLTYNVDFKMVKISKNGIGYTLLLKIPDKIFSESSSVRLSCGLSV
ncbi:hypothetical protein [Chryseobacterium sp. G0201]|uniref:hypothetical protein n=1 Tax=Chryseobacterium sp. G0201 TaxID=2487065 RepID=UPI000F50DC2F|nr:hypothetical protein [Chryseobacterium sp. G0201]AZA52214.1 hypothetical protein EG348_03920 [Chryseobacterium sp. G0201]